MTKALQEELDHRATQGQSPRTIKEIDAALRALGYRLDRRMDCRSMSRYMTGERAGKAYPCITTGIAHVESGLSFANADAPRDDNFRALQDMRLSGEWFAVTRGAILEL